MIKSGTQDLLNFTIEQGERKLINNTKPQKYLKLSR